MQGLPLVTMNIYSKRLYDLIRSRGGSLDELIPVLKHCCKWREKRKRNLVTESLVAENKAHLGY